MRKKPDFFLNAAGEHAELTNPRACWVKGRLSDDVRDDYMLVEIEPPLIGQKYGLGDRDINHLIIATRHKDFTLFPITEWPSYVYICRILDETIIGTKAFASEQVEMLAWGMIYRTPDELNTG